jgi:hypothetical protein
MPEEFDPTLNPEPEPEMPADDGLGFIDDAGIDQTKIVTIISNGRSAYVQIEEPLPFSAIMQMAGLTYNGGLNVYMNGQQVAFDTVIPGGSTVTVVGK